jgi:enoyl-CoA hydratase/carnithine racemase
VRRPADPRGSVRLEVDGGLRRLRLPGGWLDLATVRQIDACLDALEEDDDVRVLVLVSEGPDFCLGIRTEKDASAPGLDWLRDPPGRLGALPAPVVAALRGHCRAEGLSLALGADVVVAAPDLRCSLPELALGRLPRWGAIARLVRAGGPALATSLVLLGEEVGAERLVRHGLVHVLDPEPERRAEQLARSLLERGPLALELAKEAIRRGVELPLDHALRLEADANHLLQASEDRAEGLAAFFERRPPRFAGR